MKKPSFLTIVTLYVVTLATVWFFLPDSTAETDARTYAKWQRANRNDARVLWCENHLPNTTRFFHLSALDETYWDEHKRLGTDLVASGYLTNVAIKVAFTPTNTSQFLQMTDCLRRAFQGKGEWEFWVVHNRMVIVTCQPQSMLQGRQAIQQWEALNTDTGPTTK
jgi:hypothetical protein